MDTESITIAHVLDKKSLREHRERLEKEFYRWFDILREVKPFKDESPESRCIWRVAHAAVKLATLRLDEIDKNKNPEKIYPSQW